MKKLSFKISDFPVYYGYIIIFAGIIGILMSIPGQTMGVSVFTDHLIKSYKLTRNEISLTYMFGTLLSSMFLPYAGRLYDKYGARVIAPVAGIILSVTLVFLSQLDHIGYSISLFIPVKQMWIVFALTIIAFWMLRFSGQGVLTMVSRNMVMKWFNKRRGIASAILAVSLSFGLSYSPQLFDKMNEQNGWRMTWIIIAIIIGGGFVLFSIWLFRDNPKKYGLIPDGKIIALKKEKTQNSEITKEYTKNEAKRTYSFWIFNIATFLYAFYFTALSFHVVKIFQNAGIEKSTAISIFLPSAFVALATQFIAGYMGDRYKLKYLLILKLFGMSISMFAYLILANNYSITLMIIGNGISWGVFGILSAIVWPRFYGLKNLGEISGYNFKWMQIGSAIAPFLFSLTFYFDTRINNIIVIKLISNIVPITFAATIVLIILSFKADNENEKI